jgi:fused signal recognition particle receptor
VSSAGGGWLARLKAGLGKSSANLAGGITDLLTKHKLDTAALTEIEDLLITADLGVETAAKLAKSLGERRFADNAGPREVRRALANEIATILEPVAIPLTVDRARKPFVILVCGVNGSGKTTTIGKLAKQFADGGLKVMLAAGDTFRAAAVEQLRIWGERAGADVIAKETGADAAGLAFEALERARTAGAEVLLIDTAGRLQNKRNLMDELAKIVRVIRKQDETAPHACLLVLDATVGQNAHSQVETFSDMVSVTGLILTKLDGSARGGVVVALAEKFGLPVHAIGVGEQPDDMRPFAARDFAEALLGLDD